MNLSDYLSHKALSQQEFADLIGVSQGMVYQWVRGKTPVSPPKAVRIERMTEGLVTRKDLHPDDWADIWPELDATSGSPSVVHTASA